MSPKTIEATGQENESKYRSGRGTGLLRKLPEPYLSTYLSTALHRNLTLGTRRTSYAGKGMCRTSLPSQVES